VPPTERSEGGSLVDRSLFDTSLLKSQARASRAVTCALAASKASR